MTSPATGDPPTLFPCPQCRAPLTPGTLACPNCGGLVYVQRLNEIAASALPEEAVNPIRAATLWQQALPLLPADSQQFAALQHRIGALTAQLHPAGQPGAPGELLPSAEPPATPTSDPLWLALIKTVGSMLLSIAVYSYMWDWQFATGFVLLILVHELGHVVAMKYYGLSASPPIFIPFLGALINLRQLPRDAMEESVVGIGGPFFGTLAAFATYAIYVRTGNVLFLDLAHWGFLLNLFNMTPVPPLDGGRITAAISPWVWMPGLLYVVWMMIDSYRHGRGVNYILILLLFYAWPRVRATLAGKLALGKYYQIGIAKKTTMAVAYVLLGVGLLLMTHFTR